MYITLKTTCKRLDANEDDMKKLHQGCQDVTDLEDKTARNIKEEKHNSQVKVKKQS